MDADRLPADGDTLLLEYVRERDMPCPSCGYNLRNLPAPTCPECREPLSLSVGFRAPPIGWLIATIAPGCFSGIAAVLLAVPLVASALLSANQPPPWPVWTVDGFGWFSGIVAFVLVKYRSRFLRQSQEAQRVWAFGAWAVHIAAFCLVILFAFLLQ